VRPDRPERGLPGRATRLTSPVYLTGLRSTKGSSARKRSAAIMSTCILNQFGNRPDSFQAYPAGGSCSRRVMQVHLPDRRRESPRVASVASGSILRTCFRLYGRPGEKAARRENKSAALTTWTGNRINTSVVTRSGTAPASGFRLRGLRKAIQTAGTTSAGPCPSSRVSRYTPCEQPAPVHAGPPR
jgi:hypothetical protein